MTTPTATPAALVRHLPLIESAIERAVPPVSPLAEAARYALGWEGEASLPGGGKRIRPSLVLLGATCAGGDVNASLPGAVAVELAHNFSLVHDDIQDRDLERHGRPTVWQRYGDAQAINVGDYLYNRAVEVLVGAELPPERSVGATAALLDALGRMLRGQWRDIEFESSPLVDESGYVAMVADKTGALLGASLQVGVLLAGGARGAAEAARAWGEDLGVAFQVRDDYLGIWGDPAETGKSNASDISRKKRSLPIILARTADPETSALVEREYGAGEPDVQAVVQALESARIRQRMVDTANARADAAVSAVKYLPLSVSARAELAEVASFLVQRTR